MNIAQLRRLLAYFLLVFPAAVFAAEPPQDCGPDAGQQSFEVTKSVAVGEFPYQFDSRFEFSPVSGVSQYSMEILESSTPSEVGRTYRIDLDNNPPATYRLHQMFLTEEGNIAVSVGNGSGLNTPEDIARLRAIFESFTGRAIVSYPVEGEPIAAFDFTVNGFTVQFDNKSSHTTCEPIAFQWDYNDGTLDSTLDPIHQYLEPGEYDVVLTVTDNNGNEDETSRIVEVLSPITANFSDSSDPATHLEILFDGSASSSDVAPITSWSWNFGDGSGGFEGNSPSVSYAYQQPGMFDVTLRVMDALGNEDSVTQAVVVSASQPVAVAEIVRDEFDPLAVTFIGSGSFDPDNGVLPIEGIVSWFWTFGDGTVFTDADISYRYNQIDTYDVTLRVTDDENDEDMLSVIVDLSYDVMADIAYSATDSPGEFAFNAAGSTTHAGASFVQWDWDFGDGSFDSGINPVHQFDEDGTYVVSLEVVDDFDQSAQTSITIVIEDQAPIAVISGGQTMPDGREVVLDGSASYDPDNSTNAGDGIVSWDWSLGDGSTATTPVASHTYAADGEYTATLTVTDDEGSMATETRSVLVNTDQEGFVVRFKGRRGLLRSGKVSHELIVSDSESSGGGILFGSLTLKSKLLKGLATKSRICGTVDGSICPFDIDEAADEVSITLSQEVVDGASCIFNPDADWCKIGKAVSEVFNNTGKTFDQLRMEAESFRELATAPPGGGLPGYDARPGESRKLKSLSSSLVGILGQGGGLSSLLNNLALKQALGGGSEDDTVATSFVQLSTGEEPLGFNSDGNLIVSSESALSDICRFSSSAQPPCSLDFGVLGDIDWKTASAGSGLGNIGRGLRGLFRPSINKIGRSGRRLSGIFIGGIDIPPFLELTKGETSRFNRAQLDLSGLLGGGGVLSNLDGIGKGLQQLLKPIPNSP